MSLYLHEAMEATAAGRQHWLDVVAGRAEPVWPEKYKTGLRRYLFAQGAVEAMEITGHAPKDERPRK